MTFRLDAAATIAAIIVSVVGLTGLAVGMETVRASTEERAEWIGGCTAGLLLENSKLTVERALTACTNAWENAE